VIRIQGRMAEYGELWFDEEPPADAGVDILVHRYCSTPIPGARKVTLQTLRTDLTRPVNEIMATFDATCRREIRRAENRDHLCYELIPESVDRLEEFTRFYDEFARQRGVCLADRHWLGRAAAAHQLILSHSSRGSEQLVWHAYLCIGATACLMHSASWLRGKDNHYRSLVGRANRWLHWQDMLCFKRAGVRYYDWGGMFRDESTADRAGINQFKRMFGGRPVQTYECTVPVNARGRIWLALRDVRRGWPLRRGAPPLTLRLGQRRFGCPHLESIDLGDPPWTTTTDSPAVNQSTAPLPGGGQQPFTGLQHSSGAANNPTR